MKGDANRYRRRLLLSAIERQIENAVDIAWWTALFLVFFGTALKVQVAIWSALAEALP